MLCKMNFQLLLILGQTSGNPETYKVVIVAGSIVTDYTQLYVALKIKPAAASFYPVFSFKEGVPVKAPLPDISAHVVNAE